jgi:hypothetical protein
MVPTDALFIKLFAIPKLARDLFVVLVETFAVVGVLAAANFFTSSESHFQKPVRVSDVLSGCTDDIRFPPVQNSLRFFKCADAAGRHHGLLKPGLVDGVLMAWDKLTLREKGPCSSEKTEGMHS